MLPAEMLRRATGQGCAEVLREELAGPLGIADDLLFHVPDRLLPRLADCEDGGWAARLERIPAGAPYLVRARYGVLPVAGPADRPEFRRAPLPASGVLTARATARLRAALAHGGEPAGVRLLSAPTLREATTARARGVDRMTGTPWTTGLGFLIGGRLLDTGPPGGRLRPQPVGRQHGLRGPGRPVLLRAPQEPDDHERPRCPAGPRDPHRPGPRGRLAACGRRATGNGPTPTRWCRSP
ncbi:hypothetical protein ACFZDG_03225 [Kitasatospora xanthocidica]|uniref:hypothetical protein n=1 Tax=Kitasatospora xanthocidica TaxID=83382 RepID=UPI0036E0709F